MLTPFHDSKHLRLGVLAAMVTVACVIVMSRTLIVLELRRQTVDTASETVTALSQITADRASQMFLAADLLLRSVQDLATKPGLVDEDDLRARGRTREFHDSLARLQRLLPQIDRAVVVDADGNLLTSSGSFPPQPPLDLSRALAFRALRDDPDQGLVLAGPARALSDGRWKLYLTRALKDDSGRFAGAAAVGIAVDYIEQSFATIPVGKDGSVSLISDDARMIARWPKADDAIDQPIGGPTPPPLASLGVPRLAHIVGVDGQDRMVADTRLQVAGVPLHVAVTRTEDAMLKPWRGMLTATVVSVAITLAILIGLVVFFLQWLAGEERWRKALIERESRISKQAAALALARDQAETAQRTRGQFLANMSHELRTPLNAVLGFADILRQQLFGPLGNARYTECADDIYVSGEHLLNIINNILDLSRIDAGKFELAAEAIDMAELIEFCRKMVADSARCAGVTLTVEPLHDAVTVHGDPVRMRQILLNLLSNAVKFTPAGGRIVVRAAQAGDEIVLEVSDTGIGMTPEDAIKVTQPFYQVDNAITRRRQGAGLGLPLTKLLVELHGGRMEIRSAPGLGTTVSIHLAGVGANRPAMTKRLQTIR